MPEHKASPAATNRTHVEESFEIVIQPLIGPIKIAKHDKTWCRLCIWRLVRAMTRCVSTILSNIERMSLLNFLTNTSQLKLVDCIMPARSSGFSDDDGVLSVAVIGTTTTFDAHKTDVIFSLFHTIYKKHLCNINKMVRANYRCPTCPRMAKARLLYARLPGS